jgi:hypothetical protein
VFRLRLAGGGGPIAWVNLEMLEISDIVTAMWAGHTPGPCCYTPRRVGKAQFLAVLSLTVSSCAFGQTYTVTTLAGGGLPENSPGTSAGLGVVSATAVDAGGNVFMALPNYNIVVRLDAATGILIRVAGTGTPGYSGDNGPATSAQLSSPSGLAFDSAGNLYIADDSVIREVSNSIITSVAGNGTRGFSGDNGPATSARLCAPHGLAVDADFNLFIADTCNLRIRKVSNGTITTVAGDGNPGNHPSNLGDGGPATSGHLFLPMGVAVDIAGNLFIADSYNQCLRLVTGGVIYTFAQVGQPEGMFIDSAGNLYIAAISVVLKFANGVMTTIAGQPGIKGFSGDGGPATNAQLNSPSNVAVDAGGNVYIADSNNLRLRMISSGIITTIAGRGTTAGYAGDGGPATSAQLNGPTGVAVDGAGNVYFADTGNNVVRKVAGGVITTVAGNGTAGFSGDGGPPTSAQLNGPSGLAVDSAGNLYIADTGNGAVRRVAGGVIMTVAGAAKLGSPSTIAVDATGALYIVTRYSYTVFTMLGIYTMTVGQIQKVSNGLVTTLTSGTQFGGLAMDSTGNLYFASGSSILKLANGVVTTFAGTGSPGFSGDNSPATSAQLSNPRGVFVDAAGALWVADTGNQRIRKVSNGIITTVAGAAAPRPPEQPQFDADGPATSVQLAAPQAIAVDASGEAFFADNNRIRVLIPSGSASGTEQPAQ